MTGPDPSTSGTAVRARPPAAEFRAVVAAEVLSVLGDQFSKIALTVTVFDRTGSAALGGLAYGLTFFPPLLTGTTLGWVADRYPRREVMVTCCLLQAAILAAVAAGDAPTVLLAVAAAAVGAVAPVFKAAQATLVTDVLGDDAGARARPVLFVLREAGLLVGLALGGVVVVAIGPVPALLVDATTFAAAAVLRCGLRRRTAALANPRQAPRRQGPRRQDRRRQGVWSTGRRLSRPVPLRRHPGALAMLAVPAAIGLSTAPVAVIAPLAGELAVPEPLIGLLLATESVGLLVVGTVLTRIGRAGQARLLWPLASMTFLPLLVLALRPPPAAVFVLFTVTGAGSMALAPAQTRLLDLLPNGARGRATALASTALRATQGVAAVLAGVLTAALGHATLAVATLAVPAAALLALAAANTPRHPPPTTAGAAPPHE